MALIHKREAARRDLIALWVWYAETASEETADRFLAAVDATLDVLAHQPESGSRVAVAKQQLAGMRRFPVSDRFAKVLLF